MLNHMIHDTWEQAVVNVVTFPTHNFNRAGQLEPPTVFSGVKFDSDGFVYARQTAGGFTNIGAWLVNGTNSTFFLSRTITVGPLTTDAGDVVQMNTDRIYDIQQSNCSEVKLAFINFSIYDNGSETPGGIFPVQATYGFSAFRLC